MVGGRVVVHRVSRGQPFRPSFKSQRKPGHWHTTLEPGGIAMQPTRGSVDSRHGLSETYSGTLIKGPQPLR